MNQVGIYFAYWCRSWAADYKYFIDKVSGLGFDILEVATGSLVDMPKLQRAEIAKYAADRKLTLTYCIGFGADKDMASLDGKVHRDGIEYAKRTVETISAMGGKIFGGINYSCWPGVIGVDADKQPYLEQSIRGMREVVKTAEDYGITYCLEIVNRFEQYLLNTVDEGLAYLEAVESPNLKLLLDTFHMNIEEDSFRDAIHKAGAKIGHFHIGETNRREPGTGRMPWNEIFGALKEVNYSGAIVMEPFVKAGGEVASDIKLYRNLHNKNEMQMDETAAAALQFVRGCIG